MTAPNDFFTLQSLGTFAGATGATALIANGIQHAFKVNPAWLALAVAEVICLGTVVFSHLDAGPGAQVLYSAYFVAFLNGFLVFCSAAGLTSLGAEATGATSQQSAPPPPRAAATKKKIMGHIPGTSDYLGVPPQMEQHEAPRRSFFTRWF